MKITIHKIILIFFVSFLVVSCHTRQNYQRANDVVDEKLFRTDALPKDSLSMANLLGKKFLPMLFCKKHIAKALENNLDIRIAFQNIASAEAYLKQSKAAYQPTISVGLIILLILLRSIHSSDKLWEKEDTSINLILLQI
jgi:hypothetical protein